MKLGNRDPWVWVTVVTGSCDSKPTVSGVSSVLLVPGFCSLAWIMLGTQQSLGLKTPKKECPMQLHVKERGCLEQRRVS